jgi:acyl-CoA reductase-like NAD-dependent aldehyde dehydrogenase
LPHIGDRGVATTRFSSYAAADALARHAVVAKVALTGSTATGEHMHEVTRADFKHLTLQLGGKSPTIICGSG